MGLPAAEVVSYRMNRGLLRIIDLAVTSGYVKPRLVFRKIKRPILKRKIIFIDVTRSLRVCL